MHAIRKTIHNSYSYLSGLSEPSASLGALRSFVHQRGNTYSNPIPSWALAINQGIGRMLSIRLL